MRQNLIVIGDGKLAKTLCYFPGLVGYVRPGEMETIYDNNDRVIGMVNTEIHAGIIGIAEPKFKKESTAAWLAKGGKLGVFADPKRKRDRNFYICRQPYRDLQIYSW